MSSAANGDARLGRISLFMLLALWLLVNFLGLFDYVIIYRQSQKPLHRNRSLIWLPAAFLNLLVGVALFAGMPMISQFSQIVLLLLLSGLLFSTDLPDVKNIFRRLLRYGLFTSGAVVYCLLFIFLYGLLVNLSPAASPIIVAGLVVFAAAVLALPSYEQIKVFSSRLVPEVSDQMDAVIREFTQNIRNTFSLEDLSVRITNQIFEIIDAEEIFILNVSRENQEDQLYYHLHSPENTGRTTQELLLSENGPIPQYFLVNHQALSQYHIDFLANFANLPQLERTWLDQSGIDLYVPIIAKEQWIGLICLGPKRNGLPYTRSEEQFLMSIADQTAIAFENARLINGLTRLNNDYRRAYAALEKTNTQLQNTVRKLEKLDRFKSDLITVLSHELRTPMTLIAGYAQLLLDEPDIIDNSERGSILQGINIGTERLEDIVTAILDMANIDSHSLDLQIRSAQLQDILSEVLTSLKEFTDTRNINISVSGVDTLPPIQTDPQLLKKAIYQIITNSIKYSPDQSEIRILGIHHEQPTGSLSEPAVEIQITDQGIGIDQDQLDIVFEKLYQLGDVASHSSGKSKYKGGGPGLGLAIAKGIINELYGQLWAESAGHDEQNFPGSTFHLLLPLKRDPTNKMALEGIHVRSLNDQNEAD
ncbi:MAG: ATP-binding protein [Anaerolineales bacterium]